MFILKSIHQHPKLLKKIKKIWFFNCFVVSLWSFTKKPYKDKDLRHDK